MKFHNREDNTNHARIYTPVQRFKQCTGASHCSCSSYSSHSRSVPVLHKEGRIQIVLPKKGGPNQFVLHRGGQVLLQKKWELCTMQGIWYLKCILYLQGIQYLQCIIYLQGIQYLQHIYTRESSLPSSSMYGLSEIELHRPK